MSTIVLNTRSFVMAKVCGSLTLSRSSARYVSFVYFVTVPRTSVIAPPS